MVKNGSKNELKDFERVALDNKSENNTENLKKYQFFNFYSIKLFNNLRNWETEKVESKRKNKNPSLLKAVIKTFRKKILLNSLFCFLEVKY